MKAKEQVMSNLEDLADGIVKIGDRVLTFCVACGDPRHTLSECEFDTGRIAEVNRGIEIMRQALCRYPKHQPRLRGADATSDAPMQPADEPEVQLHLQPDDPQPKRDPVVQQSLPT